jgi:hypothetical protein
MQAYAMSVRIALTPSLPQAFLAGWRKNRFEVIIPAQP